MILTKKIAHIFALVFLVLSLASCKEECIAPDEFDTFSTIIESNPVKDGIYGFYDPVSGGQRAEWHATGLRSNGTPLLLQIDGGWIALEGDSTSLTNFETLPRCNFCAKRYDGSAPNCICYKNQEPTPEKGINGVALNVDCSDPINQEDPEKCTCTTQHGLATDYGAYHFPLNIKDKNESVKVPDKQTNCKYDRGMGAYIALWGSSGAITPLRAYHLFSEEEVCNVVRDSQGRCLDSAGKDVTKYVFRSANQAPFLKDDGIGNHTIDFDGSDDTYHKPNEKIKTIMYDSYYSDNYGFYNLRFLSGVGDENDPGILEFLVGLVEDVLLGKIDDETGERKGGILEFMYKAIIKDSGFALTVQVALSLYIALFGLAHLFGVVEISSKKEIMSRVLKIALIIFFISDNSWYFYNKIVVSFFKDSMDYVVGMILDLQDAQFDATSMIKIAQMEREIDASNGTRFSYVDLIIKNMFSSATTKKIWGLFFESIFGFLYIPIIYALIFFFIYVMLYVASMYVSNLIKIIFVLSLGPIFMVFTLFSKTSQMFKNWLGYLGGRSLEVIIIFITLYLFVTLIDKAFTDLLYYRVCGENKGIWFIKIVILLAQVDRSFVDWLFKFINVGGLIYITYLVIQKVPNLSSSLVSIGGVGGGSGSGMAGGMMSGFLSLSKTAAGGLGSLAANAARFGGLGAGAVMRATGLNKITGAIGGMIPIPSPRSIYRNVIIIDGAIKKAKAAAGGLSGAERDRFIRNHATKALQLMMYNDPKKFSLLANMDIHGKASDQILARFDKKLVKDPLKKFLKDEAKAMKGALPSQVKFGKDAQDLLKQRAMDWASKNLAEGDGRVKDYLNKSGSLNRLINEKTELSASRASELFKDDKAARDRYLQHLQDKQARNYDKRQEANKHWYSRVGNALGRGYDSVFGGKVENPHQVQKDFLKKQWEHENNRDHWYNKNRDIHNSKGFFRVNEDISGYRQGFEKQAMLANMNGADADYARDRLRHLALKGDGQNDGSAQSIFDSTAKEAYGSLSRREKMFGNDSFRKAHEALLEAQYNSMPDGVEKTKLGILLGKQDAADAMVDCTTPYANGINDANVDKAKQDLFVAQSLQVDFGAPLTDALLKESDLGLKDSNVTLGVADNYDSQAANESLLNSFRVGKQQASAKKQVMNLEKKIKEFELGKLEAKQRAGEPVDAREMQRLQDEIKEHDKEISKYESEEARFDREIMSNSR